MEIFMKKFNEYCREKKNQGKFNANFCEKFNENFREELR